MQPKRLMLLKVNFACILLCSVLLNYMLKQLECLFDPPKPFLCIIKSPEHCTQAYLQLTEIYTQFIATHPHNLLWPGVWNHLGCSSGACMECDSIFIMSLSDSGQHNLLKTPHQKLCCCFAAFYRDYFRFLKKISRFSNMPSELKVVQFYMLNVSF